MTRRGDPERIYKAQRAGMFMRLVSAERLDRFDAEQSRAAGLLERGVGVDHGEPPQALGCRCAPPGNRLRSYGRLWGDRSNNHSA
jgi:hypothetical protein